MVKKYFDSLEKETTLELISVPGGNFTMGSPVTELGSTKDERPQHRATVSNLIGKWIIFLN